MPDEPITIIDKLREAERELDIREKYYPRWLGEVPPRIAIRTAAVRLSIMRAIVNDYRRQCGMPPRLTQTQLPLVPADADHEPEAPAG
jgi:hypothetical protein